MKKAVILMFLSHLILTMSGHVLAQNMQPTTLNGYKLSDAKTMVSSFNAKDHSPTYVWFSEAVIKKILNLLQAEKAANRIPADGIRVYFGTINNQNTILLVSTFAYGDDESVVSKTYHQDYYDHDQNDPLFQTAVADLHGGTFNYSSINPRDAGAKLYQDCGTPCPDDKKCNYGANPSVLHYMTRLYGQTMVGTFGSATTNIVTESEWFDLNMLSEIDADMRQYFPSTSNTPYDGIRIYFGKHPSTDPISPVKDAFDIEATTKDPNNSIYHVDSFNCNIASTYFQKVNMAKLIRVYVAEYKSNLSKKRNIQGKKYESLAEFTKRLKASILDNGLDNGEICPTHCPGASLLPQ